MTDDTGSQDDSSDSFDALLERAARLTPWPVTQHLHPGLELCDGRFQLLRRLGSGGMGVVYEAFDRSRGSEVALKTLSHLSPNGIYRMKNEFRGLAHVMHPNLVRLHDLFADDGMWLFTMELVNGRPFDEWVRPGDQLELRRTRVALAQILSGVEAIHAAGKLHRDLKPSNVLAADGGGRIVILDFGLLADPEPGGSGQTRDTAIAGTPHYMAPEQAGGRPCSGASDLYAVGVMLFEALTGQLPFDGNVVAIMQRKQRHAAPRASSLAEGIPPDLDELCAALLERDPGRRPDAATLARQLHAQLGSSIPAPNPREPRETVTLFGRSAELALLHAAQAAANAGQPTVVCVQGDSGIGKSTLVQAFLDELRGKSAMLVLSGRCYERENLPYKAFDRVIDELTRHLRQLREVDVESLLPRYVAALGLIFPVLCRVEAVAARGTSPNVDAGELRKRAFDALAELLARVRDRQTLVVHIDDLHWLDHDSTLLLERLFGDPDPPPVLFVLAQRARTDDDTALLLARVYDAARQNPRMRLHDLVLGPLSSEATLQFANAALQPGEATDWGQAVAAESGGNPFFISELARAATHAAARGDRPLNPASFTLEHMLAERAKSFGSTEQALLEVLAVAGRPTPVAVAVRAAAATDDPHRAVDVLRNARMLRESGKRSYECYHDRIAAAVRASLPQGAVQRYHRELATAWTNRPDADPEVLFDHWLAAGEPQLAGTYAVRAADNAAASLAFERCATFLGHALAALPSAAVEASDLQARRAQALSLAGRWSDAAHAFGQASDACKQPERSAELQLRAAMHYLGSGHGDQGLPRLAKLLEEAGIPWPRSRVLALASACVRLTWLWLRGASAHTLTAVTAQEHEETAGPSLYGNIVDRWLVGAGLVPAYDFARGIYFMSGFSARGLRSADPGRRALALGMLAALFGGTRAGRTRARVLSDQAVALAHTAGSYPVLASTALSFVAYTRLQAGSLHDALELGEEAEHLLDAEGQAHAASAWAARAAQAHALFAMGRLGDAAHIFERSARIALQSGDDLALLGGDSVMRKLVVDDVAGAHALLDRKERLLARMPSRGVLQELAKSERMLCALYEGQGEVALVHADQRTVLHALLDPGTLPACAALQVDPAGKQPRTRRLVRRAVRRLRAQGELGASQATAWQLTAALRLFDHDLTGACEALAAAHEQYQKSGMAMHAALMRLRLSGLQRALGTASPQAEQTASDDALRFLREQGATRPEAWVQMLAPGLAAPAHRVRSTSRP